MNQNRRVLLRRAVWEGLVVVAALALLAGVFGLWWSGRPERHLAAAERLIREGDSEGALQWLAAPESTPTTHDRALLLRARVAIEGGRVREAVRALDQVSPHGPCAADFAFWKGRTLLAARQPLLAIPWFEASLRLRPADADAYRWLAAAAYDLGDRPTAVAALEDLTRLQPQDSRAWRTLALVFKENVEYERAQTAYEATLRLDRNQPQVRLELAETLVRLGELAEAERELASCKGQVSEAERSNLLAQCRQLRGDLDGWRAALEDGLAMAPDHPGLLAQRARIDLAEGRAAEALERLDRALAADPYQAQTLYQRGAALSALGRAEEARRDFARSAELNQGLAEMSALNEQASRAPHDADVRYRLGNLCITLGKPDLAASWYRAALACDPRHEGARLGLQTLRAR